MTAAPLIRVSWTTRKSLYNDKILADLLQLKCFLVSL